MAAPVRSYGQQGLVASDPVIKACEQAVDELKVKRVEVDGLKAQILLFQDRDKLKDSYIANLEQQSAFWKDAATARKDALSIDDRIEKIRLGQLTEYKDEITRLRAENEKLRRSRDRRFMIGGVIGIVAGTFLHLP